MRRRGVARVAVARVAVVKDHAERAAVRASGRGAGLAPAGVTRETRGPPPVVVVRHKVERQAERVLAVASVRPPAVAGSDTHLVRASEGGRLANDARIAT